MGVTSEMTKTLKDPVSYKEDVVFILHVLSHFVTHSLAHPEENQLPRCELPCGGILMAKN